MLRSGSRSRARKQLVDAETVDHIVPQSKIWAHGNPDAKWQALNRIAVCSGCNGDKGDMYPLDWLIVMPAHGVETFCARLRRLGCSEDAIEAALRARELAAEAGKAFAAMLMEG